MVLFDNYLFSPPSLPPSLPPTSLKDKFKFIVQATFQHARNLALLASIYKVVTLLGKKMLGREHPLVTFLAAFTGGYFVFGKNDKINMQVWAK